MERGEALPPFSTVVTATPEGTDSVLESHLSERGQLEPRGAGSGRRRKRSDRGKQGYISLHLLRTSSRGFDRDSVASSSWVCIPCPHGEQVHASFMLNRAECLVSGHADPHPRVTCRFEWPARNRPRHPTKMAEDRPKPLPGGRWPAVEGALQLTHWGGRHPAAAAGKIRDAWLSRNFRTDGEDPWEEPQPSRSCCAPCSAMLVVCPNGLTWTSPDRGNGKQQPATIVRFSPRTPSERILFTPTPKSDGLHPTPRSRVPGGSRLRHGRPPDEVDRRGTKPVGNGRCATLFSDGGVDPGCLKLDGRRGRAASYADGGRDHIGRNEPGGGELSAN